jgi:hypothetical protein
VPNLRGWNYAHECCVASPSSRVALFGCINSVMAFVVLSLLLDLLVSCFCFLTLISRTVLNRTTMAPLQISTLIILLFSYLTIHALAVHDGRPPFSHLQPGPVACYRPTGPSYLTGNPRDPQTSHCRVALSLIPSGRFTFEGGDPPTWSIEPPAQRRKFLPAAFRYRTCTIEVLAHTNETLPRSLGSLARTMYYHVWPAAREAVARVLQKCDGVGGDVMQTLIFDGQGPYRLGVFIDNSELPVPPHYHLYSL